MATNLTIKRPWPISLFNVVTKPFGLNELNSDKLISQARKKTGHHDLGDTFNKYAVDLLIQSAREEARLNEFGRLMFREKLLSQLENRLWAEYWLGKYPEILDQAILPVYWITGLQRTGTTKMQRLLSGQEGARGLYSWEALYPAPIGDENESAKRLGLTRRNEKAARYISPVFFDIHPVKHQEPEEDVLLLDVHFMSTSSEAILSVPSYAKWLQTTDNTEAYEYQTRLLKLLQWQRGGKYWVLKSPHHMEHLNLVKKLHPQAKVIWMHRDPLVTIPSFLSMLYHSRAMFSDDVRVEEIKEQWLTKLQYMLKRGLEDRALFSGDQLMDIHYQDLIKDEGEVLRNLGLSDRPALPNNEVNYQSRHRYSLDDWDLTNDDLRDQFSDYLKFLNHESAEKI